LFTFVARFLAPKPAGIDVCRTKLDLVKQQCDWIGMDDERKAVNMLAASYLDNGLRPSYDDYNRIVGALAAHGMSYFTTTCDLQAFVWDMV
jgi:hypothetical protein